MQREYLFRHAHTIHRPRIDKLLSSGLEYPLIAVIAPPGYGKTIAVSEFCRTVGCRLILKKILPTDNDANHFWESLKLATKLEVPQLAQELAQIPFPRTLPEIDACNRVFAKYLFHGRKVLLVVDNAAEIENKLVLQFFNTLLKLKLDNFCILYVSNSRLHLKHLIGTHAHIQIGASELEFNEQETTSLFSLYGHELQPQDASRLIKETGGWPLALHLIASKSDAPFQHCFGETPYLQVIAEKFEEKYFSKYEPAFQNLLVKMSFFESVPTELLKSLNIANMPAAFSILADHIFISYDHLTNQYFLQKMYRDFLANKQSILSMDEKSAFLLAAGEWFFGSHQYSQAQGCFWQLRDHARFMVAIQAMPLKPCSVATANALLATLNQLKEEYQDQTFSVDFYRGLFYLKTGKLHMAQNIFEHIRETLEASPDPPPLLGEVYAGLYIISMAQYKYTATQIYLRKMLALIPPGSRVRAIEITTIGNNDVFFLPDYEPGQLPRMITFINGIIATLNLLSIDPSGHYAYAQLFAAEGYFYACNMDAAFEHSLQAAHTAYDAAHHDIAANALYLLMRIALFKGTGDRAKRFLHMLIQYVDAYPSSQLLHLKDCANAFFCLRMNDHVHAPAWLSSPQKLINENVIDIGRNKVLSAFFLFSEKKYEQAYRLAVELESFLNEHKRWSLQIAGYLLKAACMLSVGKTEIAMRAFFMAYQMTYQNNMNSFFVEFGRGTLALITAAQRQDAYPFDRQWLDSVYEATLAYTQRETAMLKSYGNKPVEKRTSSTALTPREKEVFQYIAKGLTRGEMSALLGISLNGVKKHITNIYNKLGAINRIDALHIGMANGLLDPDYRISHTPESDM
ncbi:LuxR C-terminal-related transcriptional regulator [Christensenellaceae bacterium OttesenSCG-928-M15]|nr:LuxR C-terminal-related transcriptional regulator [Christensenellaceae bacterium OttesenSCG-928-M15]